jgi:hypothetical protein
MKFEDLTKEEQKKILDSRYCVSLMYDKVGINSSGRYVDYRIESIIIDAQNEKEAKLVAINTLKDKMKEWCLCVDKTIRV